MQENSQPDGSCTSTHSSHSISGNPFPPSATLLLFPTLAGTLCVWLLRIGLGLLFFFSSSCRACVIHSSNTGNQASASTLLPGEKTRETKRAAGVPDTSGQSVSQHDRHARHCQLDLLRQNEKRAWESEVSPSFLWVSLRHHSAVLCEHIMSRMCVCEKRGTHRLCSLLLPGW